MRVKTELEKYNKWWEKQKMHETFTAVQGWLARANVAHVENARLLDSVQKAMEDIVGITDAVMEAPAVEFERGKPEGVLLTYEQIDTLCRSILQIVVAHESIDLGEEKTL